MDIKQLKYFIAIAEEKQITAAAKKLHMAQPPLSQQLKQMELELGVTLVERKGKTLHLTEAGTALYNYALTITKYMEEAQTEVKEIGEGLIGKLSIGVNTISDHRLPDVLCRFREAYPGITYKIQQNETAQLCRLLFDRVIELAIVRLPIRMGGFSSIELGSEPFYFLTSDRLELESSTVTYKQIRQYPLLLPSTEGLGLYHFIMEQFATRGLSPHIIGECSDISMLLKLVSTHFGATVVPETVLKAHPGYAVRAYRIDESSSSATSAVIWLKDHHLSKSARRLIDLLTSDI